MVVNRPPPHGVVLCPKKFPEKHIAKLSYTYMLTHSSHSPKMLLLVESCLGVAIRDNIQITVTRGLQSCSNLIIQNTCDKAAFRLGDK